MASKNVSNGESVSIIKVAYILVQIRVLYSKIYFLVGYNGSTKIY